MQTLILYINKTNNTETTLGTDTESYTVTVKTAQSESN
jgi:hypothetical protein